MKMEILVCFNDFRSLFLLSIVMTINGYYMTTVLSFERIPSSLKKIFNIIFKILVIPKKIVENNRREDPMELLLPQKILLCNFIIISIIISEFINRKKNVK